MYKIYFQDLSSKINARENEYSHSGNLGLTTYSSVVQPHHLNPYIVQHSTLHNHSGGNIFILFIVQQHDFIVSVKN